MGLELPELDRTTVGALRAVLPADASVANPVDLLGSATAATYAAALPLIMADPQVDAVIALFVPPVVAGADEVAEAIVAASRGGEKPLLAAVISAGGVPAAFRKTGAGVAAFAYPESAARALGFAAERADWLRRPSGTETTYHDIEPARARALVETALGDADERWLDAGQIRTLLEAYRLPLVAERIALTAEDAVAVAGELGFPVVVKTAAAGVHKSDVGGVALNLPDADAVRTAVARIGPPVLVQPHLENGVELLAGVVQDPVFGPLVAFGAGGVMAELIGDAGIRVAPLSNSEAVELVFGGKPGRLVRGFRGQPAADGEALVELVGRLGQLAADLPEIAELDLNPIMAFADGCIAVDARARVSRPQSDQGPKRW